MGMKRHCYVMIVLAVVLVLAALLWLLPARDAAGSVSLACVGSSSNQPFGGTSYRVTNGYNRAILLTDLIVETNSPAGWQAFTHTIPTHPQRLATGDTKDLVVAPPRSEQAWRLRVTYGTDVQGPELWLGKVEFAVSRRTWPGRGFGIMAGSNSCISGGMTQ
jgi:hypothetical protein